MNWCQFILFSKRHKNSEKAGKATNKKSERDVNRGRGEGRRGRIVAEDIQKDGGLYDREGRGMRTLARSLGRHLVSRFYYMNEGKSDFYPLTFQCHIKLGP